MRTEIERIEKAVKKLRWLGPFALGRYFADLLNMGDMLPPFLPGVYVVSDRRWKSAPPNKPLYVGATGNLRERLGNFMRDILGFYGRTAEDEWIGAHSGAQALRRYCKKEGDRVGDLFLAWAVARTRCQWCLEKSLANSLAPIVGYAPGRDCCCSQ